MGWGELRAVGASESITQDAFEALTAKLFLFFTDVGKQEYRGKPQEFLLASAEPCMELNSFKALFRVSPRPGMAWKGRTARAGPGTTALCLHQLIISQPGELFPKSL